jgi:thiaminase
MYGGEKFEMEVEDYIAMVNRACETADEATLKEMEKHFIMCCKLEHMFWDQAERCMKLPDIVSNRKSKVLEHYDSIS